MEALTGFAVLSLLSSLLLSLLPETRLKSTVASGGESAAAALVADGAANAVYTVFAAGKQRFRRVSPV